MDVAYSEWIKNGMQIQTDPCLEVRILGLDERGIYTRQDLPANSTLAIVPFSSLLSTEHANKVSLLSRLKSLCREDDLLSLLLLYEKKLGPASMWYQHIIHLPKTYHSIVNHSAEELQFIQGSELFTTTERWKCQISNDYKELNEHIAMVESIAEEEECSFFRSITFEDYLWALSTIWSRFISITRRNSILRVMVPFVDFLNHHPCSQVGHSFNEANDSFYLITNQSFQSNDEICLNYGHNSNSRLMMLYGFSLMNNPYNSVNIWITMNSNEKNYSVRRDILSKSFNIISDDNNYVFQLERNKLPDSLLIFLIIQHMSAVELDNVSNQYHSGFQLIENANSMILEELAVAIRAILYGYPHSLGEDEEQLDILGIYKRSNTTNSSIAITTSEPPVSSTTTSAADNKEVFIHPMYRKKHSLIMIYHEKLILQSILDQINARCSPSYLAGDTVVGTSSS